MFRFSTGRSIAFACLAVSLFAGLCNRVAAQSQVLFGSGGSTGFPGPNFGLQEDAGLAAQTYEDNLFVWFRGDRTDNQGVTYLCGVGYPNSLSCNQDGMPASDGPGQLTVFKNQLYMAYAYTGTRQLVVCHGTNGLSLTCNLISNIFVANSPAIAVTPDGTELDIAYQENEHDHYLGLAYSTDGVNFTNTLSSTYAIGHSPAMTAFNGKLVIAAFCQCDGHYLDVYTSTGHGQVSFLTEDRNLTLSNASPPSLAVAGSVLVLGYIQNNENYFQVSTSYDATNWTSPVRQTLLVNAWGGPALAVYQNLLWVFYNPQGTTLGARQLAYSNTSLPY